MVNVYEMFNVFVYMLSKIEVEFCCMVEEDCMVVFDVFLVIYVGLV